MNQNQSEFWATGDSSGLVIPTCEATLLECGAAFLTRAFQASGVLTEDNCVTRIIHHKECKGGSTGRKLLLTVEYAQPSDTLHTQLFVKFSRDFDNPIRDRLKDQLEAEVRLARLSQTPEFPIAVPRCYFADYEQASGSGLLLTECIAFGTHKTIGIGEIEPLYEKCLDYQIDNPLEHYQAIVRALARLFAAHKSGPLRPEVERRFAFEPQQQSISQPLRYNQEQLLRRVKKLSTFVQRYPQLLPAEWLNEDFCDRLQQDLPLFLTRIDAVQEFLLSDQRLIGLMHWNANIDNAWFWRDNNHQLQCGLMDWGSVGQMNVGQALWGALSAAETDLFHNHLDDLLTLFTDELCRNGMATDPQTLQLHLRLSTMLLGLNWLMDAPALIEQQIPQLHTIEHYRDAQFAKSEMARSQRQMLINFLSLWHSSDMTTLFNSLKNTSH